MNESYHHELIEVLYVFAWKQEECIRLEPIVLILVILSLAMSFMVFRRTTESFFVTRE